MADQKFNTGLALIHLRTTGVHDAAGSSKPLP